jgi:predicted amidophosphoribosyltransferase
MRLQEGFITYGASGEGESLPAHGAAKARAQKQTCPHFYLCHYCPRQNGKDRLSYSLLRFKHGAYPDRDAWISCVTEALQECKKYLTKDTLILRAFHHWETEACQDRPSGFQVRHSALDVLGKELSRKFGCTYAPDWLGKKRATSRLGRLRNRGLRDQELTGVYYWRGPASAAMKSFRYVWVIDDILTTGSTIASILETILPMMGSAQPFALTLGKTSVDSTFNHKIKLSTRFGTWSAQAGWVISG